MEDPPSRVQATTLDETTKTKSMGDTTARIGRVQLRTEKARVLARPEPRTVDSGTSLRDAIAQAVSLPAAAGSARDSPARLELSVTNAAVFGFELELPLPLFDFGDATAVTLESTGRIVVCSSFGFGLRLNSDGTPDTSREVMYVGETQVLSQIGTLPITFPLEAKTLEEAAKAFGPAAKAAIERAVKELQELRRQAASSIVIPQGGMPPMPGVGGGGKIQMP